MMLDEKEDDWYTDDTEERSQPAYGGGGGQWPGWALNQIACLSLQPAPKQ